MLVRPELNSRPPTGQTVAQPTEPPVRGPIILHIWHKWNYFLQTVPDRQDRLEPLERAVSQILIPTITGHKCSQLERDVLSLPVRCGGFGFGNQQEEAARELNSSVETTALRDNQTMSQ